MTTSTPSEALTAAIERAAKDQYSQPLKDTIATLRTALAAIELMHVAIAGPEATWAPIRVDLFCSRWWLGQKGRSDVNSIADISWRLDGIEFRDV